MPCDCPKKVTVLALPISGKQSTRPLRFTRMRLKNWRNFPSVDLQLELRAFFVGPNASGKSNLLDAIRFLADIARPGSGGLRAAIDVRGGTSAIRCLHAKQESQVEIEVDIGHEQAPRSWHYRLSFNVRKPNKFATIISETIEKDGNVVRSRTRGADDDDLEFSESSLEHAATNKNFRELTEFLGSCRYLHVVPQIVRDRRRSPSDGEDPFGGDLLRRIKEMPKKTREPRLNRISEALKIAVPQFRDIELKDDADGIPHLYASYVHWRHNASQQSEAFFSDGTLRFIGLLWSISEKGGPLLLEEPELSLNDAVVRELPRMFSRMQRLSGRQVIATTHSSSLLDDTSIGLKEVHIITVGNNGSRVETSSDNQVVAAQVAGGMTISQAALPLVQPKGIERLEDLRIAG